jgi:triacylglycerol lipase
VHRLAALLVALAAVLVAAPPSTAAPGPALQTPARELAAALTCPSEFVHRDKEVVLLVHGTAVTAEEHWGWNYAKHLPATGRDVCSVHLPDRALGDIQTSAEYVVAAVRHLARKHGPVDVIGHSQGALVPRWAMRWWPDVARNVDDAILLAGPHHGTGSADLSCAGGSCAPAVWQMRTSAALIEAINRDGDVVAGPDVSSIYSATDELVQPSSTAYLDGAANVLVQDLCPGRPVHHAGLNSDPVVWGLVLPALDRPGPVDLADHDPATCLQPWYDGMTAADAIGGNVLLYGNGGQAVAQHEQVGEEPPLRPYAAA